MMHISSCIMKIWTPTYKRIPFVVKIISDQTMPMNYTINVNKNNDYYKYLGGRQSEFKNTHEEMYIK